MISHDYSADTLLILGRLFWPGVCFLKDLETCRAQRQFLKWKPVDKKHISSLRSQSIFRLITFKSIETLILNANMANINSFSEPKSSRDFREAGPWSIISCLLKFLLFVLPRQQSWTDFVNFDQPRVRVWQKAVLNDLVCKNAYLMTRDPFQQPSGRPRWP